LEILGQKDKMVGGAFGHVFLPWVMELIAFGLKSKNLGNPTTVGCI
jgi:hypothetical protein